MKNKDIAWVTGEVFFVLFYLLDLRHWSKNYPSLLSRIMNSSYTDGLSLHATQVLLTRHFIFFIGCPDYWKRFNTSLYAIFFRAKPWQHAEGFCRSMDAHLVKIETRAEGVNIGSLINELNSSKVHWIGLTDIEVENLWKWSDGSSLGPHRPWAGRKTPANFTPSDCVGLYGIPWHLINCSRKQKFICEKKDWGSLKNIPSPSWLTLRVT